MPLVPGKADKEALHQLCKNSDLLSQAAQLLLSKLLIEAFVTKAHLLNLVNSKTKYRVFPDLMQQSTKSAPGNSDRSLFQDIDQGFCILEVIADAGGTAVDYKFLEVNSAFEEMTGIKVSDALSGKTIRELIPDIESKWVEMYGEIARTGIPKRFVEESTVMGRWFSVYGFRAGGDGSRRVALLFSDITAQKKVEEQLEAERSRLRYLFANVPAFVATLRGPEHIFEMTNPHYLQLIGHRDVIGKPVREALPEVRGQGFFELLDTVFSTGEPYVGTEVAVWLQNPSDQKMNERLADFVYQPIFETDGLVSGIFVHGVDVTDKVETRRQAEAANRAKDEFLATLSHELRTPLNSILGWATMLANENIDPDTRSKGLETIQRNARLQSQLIEDVLDVSRITSGKLRLEVRPMELSSVVESAIETVLPAADAKSIRLQSMLDSKASLISGDVARLQQVIWNLLTNAIKFTPKGGRVMVKTERVESHVEVVVSDTGVGIAADILPVIFERFRQADSSINRSYGGLGLGLAIVRHIVEMHGGTVSAASDGDQLGATFTIKLPLMPVSQPSDGETPGSGTQKNDEAIPDFESSRELDGLNVLVVEDGADGRMLISTVLQQCGAKVNAVASSREAFAVLKNELPDVILSDIGMPDDDGFSFISKLRKLPESEGGDIPAAALTAFASAGDRLKALRSGFQIHVPKPVEPSELIAVVSTLTKRISNR